MTRICVTGPESTGKTTLAAALATEFKSAWIPEAARLYAQGVDRELTVDDVEPIARLHIELVTPADGERLVVLDTDLLSTVVYGAHYYDFHSEWIEREARARLADLYLLCDIDVPWIPDGIRDRPDDRADMLQLFTLSLERFGARSVFVTGSLPARLAQSARVIRQMLTEGPLEEK